MRNVRNLNCHPADRVTPESIEQYCDELIEQDVSPYTLRNRIAELLAVIRVFHPDRDWKWLKQRYADLDYLAREAREVTVPPFLATEIQARCQKKLKRLMDQPSPPEPAEAVEYRNTLMILFLSLIPVRLRNFASLSYHDIKELKGSWLIDIPGSETKTKAHIRAPIPDAIVPYLNDYKIRVRPVLLKGQTSDRIWVNWHGAPMSDHAVYMHITKVTRQLFEQPINPHNFRHIGATTIVILDPEKIECARALLTHRTSKTTRDYCVAAYGIEASRKQADLIQTLRRRLPGAKRARQQGAIPNDVPGSSKGDRLDSRLGKPDGESSR